MHKIYFIIEYDMKGVEFLFPLHVLVLYAAFEDTLFIHSQIKYRAFEERTVKKYVK